MRQTFIILFRACPHDNARLKLVRRAKKFADPALECWKHRVEQSTKHSGNSTEKCRPRLCYFKIFVFVSLSYHPVSRTLTFCL